MDFRIVSFLLCLCMASASAATLTWNGSTSTAWGTDTNWTPNQIPAAGDTLILTGAGTFRPTNQNIAGLSLASVQIDASATAALTVTGSALTLTGANAVVLATSGTNLTHTFSFAISLGGDQTWDIPANRTLTVGGVVSGSGNLTKAGVGSLTLSGNNSFSGLLTINDGAVTAGNANAFGTTAQGVVLNFGTIVGGFGTRLNLGAQTITGEALQMNSNSAGNFRTALVGSGATWTGPVVLQGDGLDQFYGEGGALTVSGDISGPSFTGTLFLRGASSTCSISGSINLPLGRVQKTDASIWVIGAAGKTYNWTTTGVFVGTLRAAIANMLPPSTVVTMGQNDANNTTLDLNGFSQTIGGVILSSTGGTKAITSATAATLTINNSATNSYGGILSGQLSLVKTGAGTQVLTGNNTYTGTTTISGGTLQIGSIANGGAASPLGQSSNAAANLVLDGGTLAFSGTAAGDTDRLFTLTPNGGTLSCIGTGGNVLRFNNTGALVASGAGDRTLTLTGTTPGSSTNGEWSGNTSIVNANIQNPITGATQVTKTGTGVWALGGTSTYSGPTTLTTGQLSARSSGAFGNSAVFVAAGTQLAFANHGLTIPNDITLNGLTTGLAVGTTTVNGALCGDSLGGAGNNTHTGTLTLNATSNITTSWSDKSVTLNGLITGPGGLQFDLFRTGNQPSSIFVGNAANAYAGSTTINGGCTVRVTADNVFSSGTLILSAGRVLSNNTTARNLANSVRVDASFPLGDVTNNGALNFAGGLTLNASPTLTFDANVSFGGGIAEMGGVRNLIKAGNGALTLGGASTLTGTVTANAGTLRLRGNAGTLASIASLTLNNTLFEIDATAGGNPNRLPDTAALNLNAGSALEFSAAPDETRTETIGALAVADQTRIVLNANSLTPGQGDCRLVAQTITVAGLPQLTRVGLGSASTELGNLLLAAGQTLGGTGTFQVFERSSTVGNTGAGFYDLLEGVIAAPSAVTTYTTLASGNWDDLAIWTPTPPAGGPSFGDNIVVSSNHVLSLNGSDRASASITFNAFPAGNGSISGANTLSIGAGGIIVQALNNPSPTIACTLILPANCPITVNGNNATGLVLSGAITAGGIVKLGGGYLSLSGNNTFAGGVVHSGGFINANSNSALGDPAATLRMNLASKRLILANGVSLANPIVIDAANPDTTRGALEGPATGSATLTGPLSITARAGVELVSGGHFFGGTGLNLNGPISSTTTLVQRDQVVTYNNATNSFPGLQITGTANLSVLNAIPSSAIVSVGVSGAGTLNLNNLNQSFNGLILGGGGIGTVNTGTGTLTLNGDIASSGNFTHVLNGSLDLGGTARVFNCVDGTANPEIIVNAVLANGALIKDGTGNLQLSAVNTYAGSTTVNQGTLTLQGNVATLAASSAIVLNAGVLDISATAAGNPNRIGDTVPVTLNAGALLQLTAPLDELRFETIGALTLNDQSQVAVNAASNTAGMGDARITASTITASGNVSVVRRGTGSVSTELGNLLAASGSLAGAGTVNVTELSSTISRTGAATYDLTEGVIAGGTTATVYTSLATGNWDNTANWTPTPPAGGPAAGDYVIIAAAHNISLNGANRAARGVTFSAGGTISGANMLALGDGGIAAGAATATVSSLLNLGGATRTLSVQSGGTLTLSAVISNGGIVKTGGGLLALTSAAANTFAGGLNIAGGVVSFTNDNQLGAVPGAATPGNIVLNGGTLRTGTTLTINANRGIALGPLSGNGTGIFDITANTVTYSGVIANNGAGTGSLTKTGAGLLLLNGATASTYSGGVIITGGVLQFTNDGQFGAVPPVATPGSITIVNAQLRYDTNAALTLNANRGMAIGPASGTGFAQLDFRQNTLTYNGVIANNGAGTGELIKLSGGTLALGGANTFSGPVSISGGTLSVAADNNLGTGDRIEVVNGTTLLARATFTLSAARTMRVGPSSGNGTAILNVATGATLTYDGVIDDRGAGTGNIWKTGAGALSLGGASRFAGVAEVDQGTLIATHPEALGDPASGNGVRALAGVTLDLNFNGTLPKTVHLLGTLRAFGNVTINGLLLNGNSTVNVVNATDTLTVQGDVKSLLASNLTVTGSGTAFFNGVVATPEVRPTIANTVGRYFDTTTNYAIDSAVGINNVAFTLAPTNTVNLGSARLSYPDDASLVAAFGAQTTNSQFTLALVGEITVPVTGLYAFSNFLNDDQAVTWVDLNRNGSFDTGELIANAGGFSNSFAVGTATLTAGLTYRFVSAVRDTGGGGALIARVEPVLAGVPPVTRNLVIMNDTVPGTNSLTKTGTGSLTLAGNNTFTGNVTVQNGILALTHTNALGATSKTVTVAGDSALALIPELRLSGGIDPVVTTLTVSGNGVAGGAGVIHSLSGNNSLSASTLNLASGNGTSTFGVDAGTLTINGPIAATAANRALTLIGSGNGVINGSIADGATVGLPLTKDGSGSWTLASGSTHTGATAVNNGTLVLANTSGSATGSGSLTVSATGTLAGTGSAAGNATISGIVTPGNGGVGALSINGNVAFNTGSALNIELIGATNDALAVGGTVTLNPGVTLNLSASGTAHPQGFTILERTSTGAITGTFNGLANGATLTAGATFVIRYDLGTDGNDCLLFHNTPPAFTAAATNTTQTVDENSPLAALVAADSENDALTFTLTSGTLPAGVTLNADGTFAGVPDYTSAGTYAVQIRVADNFGGFATTALTINVQDFGFAINDVTVSETDGTATLTVTRSGLGAQAATLDVATQNGTATAGSDYTALTTTLSWTAGDTTARTVVVTILNDVFSEGTEAFSVLLSNPSAGALTRSTGVVTILDDEVLPTLSVSDATGAEATGLATLTVSYSGPVSSNTVTVDYTTQNGSALAGLDFTAATGTLTWAPFDTTPKTFTVAITDDVLFDPNETFTVLLQNVSPTASILDTTGTVQIVENDVPPGALNDAVNVGQNLSIVINVLANDGGLTNTPLTVTLVTAPAQGSAIVNADNTITYTPTGGYTGPDSFVYQVTDAVNQTSQATVSVTVKPPPTITSLPFLTPNPVVQGSPVLATAATDNGTINWSWGDGTSANGPSVTHTYNTTGTYNVLVTAISPEGLTTTTTLSVFVGLGLSDDPNGGTGGGATPPGVTGILVGGAGAGAAQGGSGKITCNYVRREKTTYQGSIGSLNLPAALLQSDLTNQIGTLIIGTGPSTATFRFDMDKRGRGKATGLPLVEFNIAKKRFKFKAQRADLTDLTEALGGPREFNVKQSQPVTMLIPVTLQIGNKVYLALTFQVKYQQISNKGKGKL